MLTPADIENRVFKKAKIGGYDINDVEDFLEKIIVDFEAVCKQVAELKDVNENLQESVKYYKSLEQGIEQTISNAQEEAERLKEKALIDVNELKERKEKEYKNRIGELDLEIKQKEYNKENTKMTGSITYMPLVSKDNEYLKIDFTYNYEANNFIEEQNLSKAKTIEELTDDELMEFYASLIEFSENLPLDSLEI